MKTRRLGSLEVPALGYGAMVLSPGMYGPIDDDTGIAALRHVIERGAGFVDTSDAYGHESHNEILIGRALKGRRDDVVVATKFGFRFPAEATPHLVPTGYTRRRVVVNTEPRYVRQYALASLRRLGIERIDLWYPHFPDPEVPIEDTVGAMGELVAEGLVAHVGLSNVTAEHLRRALAVHPVAAVQVEWSLWKPVDPELLAAAGEHGVGIVAWSPLGRRVPHRVDRPRRGRLPDQLRPIRTGAPRRQHRAVRTAAQPGRPAAGSRPGSWPWRGSSTSPIRWSPSPGAVARLTSTRTWLRPPSSCRSPTWPRSTPPATTSSRPGDRCSTRRRPPEPGLMRSAGPPIGGSGAATVRCGRTRTRGSCRRAGRG